MSIEGLALDVEDDADASAPTKRIVARGDIDLATAPELATCLNGLIGAGVKVVVIDAAAVDFLDSSGIRVLVQASKEIEASEGRIIIDNPSPPVVRILSITGLTERYKRE